MYDINRLNLEKSLWEKLIELNKPIILYGMGNGADKVINQLNAINIKPYGVMASDDFVRYQEYQGYIVKKLSDFENELDDFIILLCFGSDLENVIENIYNLSNKHTLFVPTVSLFGNEIVDKNFINNNIEKIQKVYNLLADEESKNVYSSLLYFMYTGNLKYLDKIDSNRKDALSILSLDDNESYLDLGAYTGDTVDEFLSLVSSYDSITAVEPNIKNYNKLSYNTKSLKNIHLINAGISNKKDTMFVSKGSGRMAHLNTDEGIEIDTITVDELNKDFSYIKVDIEGMEKEFIEGAKNTLSKKPKLSLSLYHKPSDLFNLILMINNINNEYEFYIRKHMYIPAWDINLYAK